MTERQKEVWRCLARGLSNKHIARELAITERTVKAHVHNLFQHLSVINRTQAALAYMQSQGATA